MLVHLGSCRNININITVCATMKKKQLIHHTSYTSDVDRERERERIQHTCTPTNIHWQYSSPITHSTLKNIWLYVYSSRINTHYTTYIIWTHNYGIRVSSCRANWRKGRSTTKSDWRDQDLGEGQRWWLILQYSIPGTHFLFGCKWNQVDINFGDV